MTQNAHRLLIVDDEKSVRDFLARVSRSLGYDVATAADQETMRRKLASHAPTVVLLDLQMPGFDGIQALKLLKDQESDARVVLVTGMDQRTLTTATQLGEILDLNMGGALQKPVLIDALREKLNTVRSTRDSISHDDMRAAIDSGEIRPVYQPKIVQGFEGRWTIAEIESLARWHREDSVVVLPSEFIGIAEEAGLLPALTHALLRQVVGQLQRWDSKGLHLTAAVNISPSILTDRAFPDQLEALMLEHELDNERLTLELTESAVMQNAGLAMEILGRLRIKDFGLAIDDFGTGYSSLEQLYRMPFNELKIDRFLVRELGKSTEAAHIVEAIIALGHKLKLTVCAEGVETMEVLTQLLDAGCDKFQGYFIGRPVSADALEERVREFERNGFAAAVRSSGDSDKPKPPGTPASTSPLPLLSL